jgi:hypothetical protein
MSDSMKAKSIAELPTLQLGEATAQDIQLELIRRRKFNAFDGDNFADNCAWSEFGWFWQDSGAIA